MAISESDLSPDQAKVVEAAYNWVMTRRMVPGQTNPFLMTLGGYAGTGKTTCVSVLAKKLGIKSVGFATLTGRASGVLRKKLIAAGVGVEGKNYCGTIHGMIYTPKQTKSGGVYYEKKPSLDFDLLILDEASMIDEFIYKDLESYKIPMLAVGDHGQLPPVYGKLNLMHKPHLRLEKIHRQAESNPIIRLSADVRETGRIRSELADGVHIRVLPKSTFKTELTRLFQGKEAQNLFDEAVLTYTNAARTRINAICREIRFGANPDRPVKDDLVICLKNATIGRDKDGPRVFNGMRGYMCTDPVRLNNYPHHYTSKAFFPDENLYVNEKLSVYQFGRDKTFSNLLELNAYGLFPRTWPEVGLLFDYGYALTTHKSQGSEFSDVVVCYERPKIVNEDGFKRWIYTSITRSSDKLTILM